jgi:hypothetical protein
VAWIKEEVLKLTNGDGAGCLIECTGAPPLVNAMFSFIRKGKKEENEEVREMDKGLTIIEGGRMVLVGVPKAPLHVEDVINDLHWKNFTLKSIHGRKMYHTWREVSFSLFFFLLFCFVLFCFVLFCFVLFCFVFVYNFLSQRNCWHLAKSKLTAS